MNEDLVAKVNTLIQDALYSEESLDKLAVFMWDHHGKDNPEFTTWLQADWVAEFKRGFRTSAPLRSRDDANAKANPEV